MNKINVIQFLPFFPPHKWWLENVAEEFSIYYTLLWYWLVTNIVSDIWQDDLLTNEKLISQMWGTLIKSNRWKAIWYTIRGYYIYLIPSFELIHNFPVPKIWKRDFWSILKIVYDNNKVIDCKTIVQTHTRFFLSSLLWWLFARYYNYKWVHIEHWSDYVKLWTKLKSKIAYYYDKTIWVWIFKKSDKIIAISEWVRKFVEKNYKKSNAEVIYNWIDFKPTPRIDNGDTIKIWFVWRLVKLKWTELLIDAYMDLIKKYENIKLEIVWNWNEINILKKIVSTNNLPNVKFLWLQDREYITNFLSHIDILVNPSYQEWLPTSVMEWLLAWSVVVATDVWWTKEISNKPDLIIVKKWNIIELKNWIENAIQNYKTLRWKSSIWVKNKFDWNENIKKYFTLFNWI